MADGRASVLPSWHELTEFGPHNDAHRVALRAGASMGIPLLVLWLSSRIDLSLYAAFGAFTALFGRNETHLARMRMQALAAGLLVGGVTIGTAVAVAPGRDWLVVPVAALYAAAGAFVSEAGRFHPPGPLFPLFAVGACASVPETVSRIPLALGVSAGSAAFSILLGVAGYAHPRSRSMPGRRFELELSRAARDPDTREALARYLIAVAIAGVIPTAAHLGHPYWSMVGAVVATSGPHAKARLVRGIQRIVGTALGVGLAALVLAIDPSQLATVAIIACLSACAELFIGRNYGVALIFVTPMALVMVELAHHMRPSVLIGQRVLETAIGAAVGMAVTIAVHHRTTASRGREPEAAAG